LGFAPFGRSTPRGFICSVGVNPPCAKVLLCKTLVTPHSRRNIAYQRTRTAKGPPAKPSGGQPRVCWGEDEQRNEGDLRSRAKDMELARTKSGHGTKKQHPIGVLFSFYPNFARA